MSGALKSLYKTILFDIDGVLLSEERYFDASALTVHEMLASSRFLGLGSAATFPKYSAQPSEDEIVQIRSTVFVQDEALELMKAKGINANWDMVYLQFTTSFLALCEAASTQFPQLVHDYGQTSQWTEERLRGVGSVLQQMPRHFDFSLFLQLFSELEDKAALFRKLEDWYRQVFPVTPDPKTALQSLWTLGQGIFQEWYLGKLYLPAQPDNKVGFVTTEIPLVDPAEVSRLFATCSVKGIEIGVATGRPAVETQVPFQRYGWMQYFDAARITTASDVLDAEQRYPAQRPLAKPNPFCYLRSYYQSPDTLEVLECRRPLPREEAQTLLIIGDSVADLLAARSIGCDFAAVLTGLSGESARTQFEALESDYIWKDVSGLWSILG